MIGFGGALTLCQLFWIIQSQSDIFIAGRVFSVYELGLYSEALFLTLIVTGRFIPPLNDVAFPAYAELHKAGRSLGPYFERTMQSVLLVVTPIYIGLALTAPEAILVVFGEKWTGMAPIVSGLAIVMPLMAVQIICSPTCTATGKEGIYLATSIAGAILFAGSFFIGVQFGAQGLVRAWWVAAPLLLVFTLALTLPQIDLPLRRLERFRFLEAVDESLFQMLLEVVSEAPVFSSSNEVIRPNENHSFQSVWKSCFGNLSNSHAMSTSIVFVPLRSAVRRTAAAAHQGVVLPSRVFLAIFGGLGLNR